jgi:hypothetical protein
MGGPARKREAVLQMQDCIKTSERRVCTNIGRPRSAQRS